MPRQKYRVPQILTYRQEDGRQNVFIRNEELGRGSFSIVYRVTHQKTNKTYAMKVISKKRCSQYREDLRNEIKIQQIVNHPNIVTLEYSFSDKRNHYFILEYCPGRTIREYLNNSQNNRLREPVARKILKDVIQGLVYIHSQGITHYDIKLENFVIGSDGNVKIGDFGLSTFHEDEKGKKFTIFGTYNYLSPEMIAGGKREETYKADIWAVGVSAFFMLTGKQPFEGKTKEVTFSNITNVNYWFPNIPISVEAKNFIKTIFRLDPKKRPSASELLEHPFIAGSQNENVCLYKTSSLPPLNMSPKPPTANLRQNLCQSLDDIQKVSPKPLTDNQKPNLCQPINDNKQVSPKPLTDNQKPNLCQPINDNKQVSPKPLTDNQKPNLCQPMNDNKKISPKPTTPNLCQQINDNKQVLSKPLTDNQKPNLCQPINDNKQVLSKPTTPDLKRSLCPPAGDNKQITPKPLTAIQKPSLCQPAGDNKKVSPKPATPNKKPALSPLTDSKQISPKPPISIQNPPKANSPISPRRQNDNQKPSLCLPPVACKPTPQKPPPTAVHNPPPCPPLSDIKHVSPRRQLISAKLPTIYPSLVNNNNNKPVPTRPSFYPPPRARNNNQNSKNNLNKPASPMPPITGLKPSCCNPRHVIRPITPKRHENNKGKSGNNNAKQGNDSRPVSARIGILGDTIAFTPFDDENSFVIPDYFVSRYSFINDNMSYMLVNGTVGICFSDNSRIVMDPHEKFVQFYENADTEFPDTVFLHEIDEDEVEEPESVYLVRKAANHFKKIRFSYDLPEYDYDPDDILHNVLCFVKNDDSILFKLDDFNFQINFNDNMKLIIFWSDKKLCFFKSIKEKCTLLDLKNATSTNLNSDELTKFKNAEILLSDLEITIC